MRTLLFAVCLIVATTIVYAEDTIKISTGGNTYLIVLSRINAIELEKAHEGLYPTVEIRLEGSSTVLELRFASSDSGWNEAARIFNQLEQAIDKLK